MHAVTIIVAFLLSQPVSDTPTLGFDALQAQLAGLVTDAGAAKPDKAEALDALATRSGQLADAADDDVAALDARIVQASAYHALALDSIAGGKASLAGLRLVQLRSTANAMRRLDTPDAKLVGDGWLLVADLIDANRNARSEAEAQIGAMAQMERFVSLHGDADAPMVGDVKYALMRVCDQAGENSRAMELLEQLQPTLAEDDPRGPVLAAVAENARFVGQAIDPTLRSEASDRWQMVVIDFSLSPERERDVIAAVSDVFDGVGDSPDVRLVTQRKGELDRWSPSGISDAFPRYLLVDSTGVIRAAGHTAAVAHRWSSLSSDVPQAP